MNKQNIVAYGTIFDAYGCVLGYDSKNASLTIIEAPKGSKKAIDNALSELRYYDPTTANYADGMAALAIADYIDGDMNPIGAEARNNILNALGLVKSGKYIRQTLMLQKNNRSWHFSEAANTCTAFGPECTHRGINPDPNRIGRRSSRKPEEYHVLDSHDAIKREQLVTKGLEAVFNSIPADNLISGRIPVSIDRFNLKEFKKLHVDKQVEFIERLKEVANA